MRVCAHAVHTYTYSAAAGAQISMRIGAVCRCAESRCRCTYHATDQLRLPCAAPAAATRFQASPQLARPHPQVLPNGGATIARALGAGRRPPRPRCAPCWHDDAQRHDPVRRLNTGRPAAAPGSTQRLASTRGADCGRVCACAAQDVLRTRLAPGARFDSTSEPPRAARPSRGARPTDTMLGAIPYTSAAAGPPRATRAGAQQPGAAARAARAASAPDDPRPAELARTRS